MADSKPKSQISDEERLELAAKLDRDLDEFIDNLPKRKQEETTSFDRWEEVRLYHSKHSIVNTFLCRKSQITPFL
jgi:hypothetical protein